jgi:hypothetical protein
MTDQNSTEQPPVPTETTIYRPEQVMELLGIKQQAYYNRINFLNIEVAKDNSRKAFLTQAQFELMKKLDQHIKASGTMDGFILGAVEGAAGGLAIADESGLSGAASPATETGTGAESVGVDEQLIRMAAEVKAQRLIMTPRIVEAIANQMSEDELPEDLKVMVHQSREAISAPKIQPAQVATNILSQWRSQRSGNVQEVAIA